MQVKFFTYSSLQNLLFICNINFDVWEKISYFSATWCKARLFVRFIELMDYLFSILFNYCFFDEAVYVEL